MGIINLGILAHVDSGKTTLTEQILLKTGAIRRAGRVDEGTAHTDYLELERRRGISIRSACVSVRWREDKINIIDTPGHVDFISEVERALMILDAAILIVSAVEGVQPQTRVIWDALLRMRIPAIVFMNKTDRAGADPEGVARQISREFSVGVFEAGSGIDAGLAELIIECDDGLMEDYLADREITSDMLAAGRSRAIRGLKLLPVCRGSALRGEGIESLLDAVCDFAPHAGEDVSAPLSGVIYKVEHDGAQGRVAHVRLFGGELKNRDSVRNATKDIEEKVFQIHEVIGGRREPAGRARAGDVAAVYGLSASEAGDIIGDPAGAPGGLGARSQPLLGVKITPDTPAALPRLLAALTELSAEDPALGVEFGHGCAYIKIMGKIQLEVIASLLRERFDLDAGFGPPEIIYKETPASICEGFEAYTMPKPCWAVIRFLIEPLPRGSGVVYETDISNELIHYRYQGQISQTIPEALRQGPRGWEVTDIRITLIDGEDHPIHTHPLDFALATPLAVMDGLARGGTTLLEPMLDMDISAPDEYLGRVLGDLSEMRATFSAPAVEDGRFKLSARVPAAESAEYPSDFAASTSGRGVLTYRFGGYQPCPPGIEAVRERDGVDPRERSKYILWKRGAM